VRLLAVVHKYPPLHNAGAEWMLHAILERLVARGHTATVAFPAAPSYRLDGVTVGPVGRDLDRMAREHDVIVTHLDKTELAVRTATQAGRPLVHLVHNDRQLQFHRVQPGPDVLVVPNSVWINEALRWPGPSIICRPPVDVARYAGASITGGDRVTLVNLTHAKGSTVFYDLAETETHRQFLGVAGAYGIQERRRAKNLRNVEIIENTANVTTDVYARTRVLLMPSSYESWGRVAVEAACSGIPTIAAPTPGLLEALGDAGTFVERTDRRGWVDALNALDDPDVYGAASARAYTRARELEKITDADQDLLEARILALIEERRLAAGAAYHPPGAMTTTDLFARKVSCPICGAGACSCTPDAKTVSDALVVHVLAPVPRGQRGQRRRYRTFQGDFNYRDGDAIRLGLRPDDESDALPLAVHKSLFGRIPAEELERAASAYRGATYQARSDFLADLALLHPTRVPAALEALTVALEDLPAPPPSTSSSGDLELDEVIMRRVGDVEAWVSGDPDRAGLALAAERSGKARPTLIAALERIAG